MVDNREATTPVNIAWQQQMSIITNIYFPNVLRFWDLKELRGS